eukprot:2763749-Prymnesium_polylepis.1
MTRGPAESASAAAHRAHQRVRSCVMAQGPARQRAPSRRPSHSPRRLRARAAAWCRPRRPTSDTS